MLDQSKEAAEKNFQTLLQEQQALMSRAEQALMSKTEQDKIEIQHQISHTRNLVLQLQAKLDSLSPIPAGIQSRDYSAEPAAVGEFL